MREWQRMTRRSLIKVLYKKQISPRLLKLPGEPFTTRTYRGQYVMRWEGRTPEGDWFVYTLPLANVLYVEERIVDDNT